MAPCWRSWQKIRKRLYLSPRAKIVKTKGTLFPSIFKVRKSKVPLVFSILKVWDIAIYSFFVDHVNKVPSSNIEESYISLTIQWEVGEHPQDIRSPSIGWCMTIKWLLTIQRMVRWLVTILGKVGSHNHPWDGGWPSMAWVTVPRMVGDHSRDGRWLMVIQRIVGSNKNFQGT